MYPCENRGRHLSRYSEVADIGVPRDHFTNGPAARTVDAGRDQGPLT